MTEARDRFEQSLDESLRAENAFNADASPYAQFLTQQRDAYVDSAMDAWQADPANANRTNADRQQVEEGLKQKFNETKLPALAQDIKSATLQAYDGQQADFNPSEALDHITTGAMASITTGGDLIGGVTHSVRHAAFNFISNIPGVGEFISQLFTYIGSKLNSLFGNEESLSWSEAGEVAQRDKIKERMGTLGQYANVEKLNQMVDNAADGITTPAPEGATPPAPEGQAQENAALLASGDKLKTSLSQDADGQFTASDFRIGGADGAPRADIDKITQAAGFNPDTNADGQINEAEAASVAQRMDRLQQLSQDPEVQRAAAQFKDAMRDMVSGAPMPEGTGRER